MIAPATSAPRVEVERYRFTVDEYYKLAEAGILGEDDRVELIEGEILMMSPIGGRHASCVDRTNRLFVQRLGERAIVRCQSPVRLDDHSEPEPDLSLLRPRDDFYASGHPGPADVLLIVEIADSSIGYDRGVKLPLYARSGIPETWIADLGRQRIDAHRVPTPQGYAERRIHRRGDVLRAVGLDLEVAVEEILPG